MNLSAGAASRLRTQRKEAKIAYIKLNIPTACPPRTAVPVNTRARFCESVSSQHAQFAFGQGCDHSSYVAANITFCVVRVNRLIYGGRMLTMTNWTNFSTGGGARVTTWGYSPTRGFLTSKTDAAGKAVSYTYTPAGRLLTRTWARGTNATYGYDTGWQLASVTYSDSTPGLTNLRDRLGRVTSTVCNGTTTSFAYDLANDVLGEWYSGGTLGGLKITNQFDTDLRRTNTALFNGATSLCQAIYGYDNASRLSTVSDGVNNAAYTYLANSSLVGQIVFNSNTVTRMTTAKQYDYLNRLTSISSTPSNSYGYLYNAANQRTMTRLADSSYWNYNYDSLGQVISGNKHWVDETPVAGQQFNYTFDNIGNRLQTQIGGDQNGANLRLANYTNNNLKPDHQPQRARVCGYHGRWAGDQRRDSQWFQCVSEERVFPAAIASDEYGGGVGQHHGRRHQPGKHHGPCLRGPEPGELHLRRRREPAQ